MPAELKEFWIIEAICLLVGLFVGASRVIAKRDCVAAVATGIGTEEKVSMNVKSPSVTPLAVSEKKGKRICFRNCRRSGVYNFVYLERHRSLFT